MLTLSCQCKCFFQSFCFGGSASAELCRTEAVVKVATLFMVNILSDGVQSAPRGAVSRAQGRTLTVPQYRP